MFLSYIQTITQKGGNGYEDERVHNVGSAHLMLSMD